MVSYRRRSYSFSLRPVRSPAYGQSAAAGALEGSVTDTAGQRLAEVTVELRNAATDERHVARADAAGAFRFSLLPPGTYQVEFAREGFKTARMAQLTLNASEVPVLDAVLEPGDSAVTVECPCHLRAVAPSTGTLVDQKTITAVPLNTRNFTQVLSMSSGSVASVNNAGTLGRGTPSVNVNGNTTAGGYTVDGAYAPSTVPNPDAISEFKIQTSQNDAMFGAMVPNTNLMTKRGENTFHGDLWEFLRNDIFNANAFFRNATGQPKPNLKQNQFGATAGGPVKRNKLFFFASYQGTRQVNGLDTTSVSNLILPGLTDDRSAATLAAQFCPGNHARRPALSDLRRRQATRLRQSEHRLHGADQSRRAAPAADEGQRRPLPDSHAADHRLERIERRARILLLQHAVHLQRASLSGQRRLRDVAAEHALGARLRGHGGPVALLRLAGRLSGRAHRSRLWRAAGAGGDRRGDQPAAHHAGEREHGERGGDDVHAQSHRHATASARRARRRWE